MTATPVPEPAPEGAAEAGTPDATDPVGPPGRRRLWWGVARVAAVTLTAIVVVVALLAGTAWVALARAYSGEVSPRARGTGHDAEWLGHAWVDGRRTGADVAALAGRLRGTGIHDLFVHTGPFNDDGTLDPALRPRARWLVAAIHRELPGVRVQAWLGAHPVPGELDLGSGRTRAALLASVGQVLDNGFDGIHYDFEPVPDGNADLLAILRETRPLTRGRGALLSVSAVHTEPWPGTARALPLLYGSLTLWSSGYLHRVAVEVDQVALMAYDTALWTPAQYGGYVRLVTRTALEVVPPGVELFIGIPAYRDEHLTHHRRAETVPAALRGVRLALGPDGGGARNRRGFGVAIYVDFTATGADWAAYRRDWAG